MSGMPSGEVTFCFTDIEGSTRLHARTTESDYLTLLERHRSILRSAWMVHGGMEVSTDGDGSFVVFGDAGAAVEACAEAQRQLAVEPWPSGLQVRVRMGLHTGEASPNSDGDYSAFAVHQAARVAAAGHGGQVVVSEATSRLVRPAKLRPLGSYRVRDFTEPVELFEVAIAGLVGESRPLRGVKALEVADAVGVPGFLRFEDAWPFTGRSEELDRGSRTLAEAAEGGRRCVVVGGEPGVGKTRLVAELMRVARRLGMVVLGGRCEPELANPFAPFTDAFRVLVANVEPSAVRRVLGRWPEELVRIVPELPDVVEGLGPPLLSDSTTERWRLLDAIVSALTALAAPSGLALVIDDVQWASPATLSVVRHVLRPETASGIALLVTYRDTELESAPAWSQLLGEMARIDGVQQLTLRGLDEDAIEALIESVVGRAIGSDGRALADAVTRMTAGNPFFAGEVVRHLVERDEVAWRDGVVTPGLKGQVLPSQVRDVIVRRVERLGERAGGVLQAGAVCGSSFDVDGVQAIIDIEEEELDDELERARRAGLVVEEGVERWRFVHALVRSAVYEEMSRSRRAHAHRRLAESLEHARDQDPSPLAHHWGLASGRDAPSRAASWSMRAGRDAMVRLAPAEAAVHLRAALDHDDRAGSLAFTADQRVAARIELGTAQRRAADPESSSTLRKAATDARVAGRFDLMGLATVADTRGFWNSLGEADDSRVQLLEESLRRLPAGHDALRARLLATLAAEFLFHERREERFAIADESLAIAHRLDDPALTFDVATHRFLSTAVPERLDRYWDDVPLLAALAEQIGDPHREILAMMVRYFIGSLSGHHDEAGLLPTEALPKADELGQPELGWLVGALRAGVLLFEGRLGEAEEAATAAFALGQAAGEADAFVWYSGQLTAIRIEQARLDELIELVGNFVATTPQLPVWAAAYAFGLCELERYDDATEAFNQLANDGFTSIPNDQLRLAALCFAAEACRRVGNRDSARQLYNLLHPFEHLAASVTVFSIGSVARSLGVLAFQLGDLDSAQRHLALAIERNSRDRSPTWTATARLDLADCHIARGRRGDLAVVKRLLDEASEDIKELGAARLERRIKAGRKLLTQP